MNENPVLVTHDGQRWTINDPHSSSVGGMIVTWFYERWFRQHIRILHENVLYPHDLDSKNGTIYKRHAGKGTVLNDGDEIQIALAVKLIFYGSDATLPLTFDMCRTLAAWC